MKFWSRLLVVWLVAVLLVITPGASTSGLASPLAQDVSPQQKAHDLLAKLTPEERVGQLFLVTFQGSTFDRDAQIYSLIADYHIGGVMLERANDNFTVSDNVTGQAFTLNRLLQDSAWQATQPNAADAKGSATLPQYIPLLIGISQEGDDSPNDQLLTGLTPLPDLMSIGATWNPSLAQQVGAVMGKELSALGFNLFLGPSLDVLAAPNLDRVDDLGVRTFGGSAFWVAKMGQAYISGLHQGSADRMMVVAKHFPGRGGSDRPPEEEIATVRKPLDVLKAVDLAPFYAVTGNASSPSMTSDGLLVSHIRYQGFQGGIRSTTRPVSSDASALEQIFKLDPFSKWREQSGILVSDNLGSQAVRRFYDPTGTNFDARTVAREAFVAGNDLLYVDRFVASGDPDTYTTLTRTLEYFAQKYREDAVFAQRVDVSVERILTLKYRLYPEFQLNRVIPSDAGLAEIGHSQPVTFDVARRSVTLISPDITDLTNILPRGPEPRDRIIFLTDIQTAKQCSNCPERTVLAVDALQTAVLRLYGPRTGGQISQNLLSSYAFSDLWKYVTGVTTPDNPQTSQIDEDLKLADWVVVSIVKPNASTPESQAFKRLLSDRADLLRNKKVVVFAFNAPYYLDATDISKVSAYYGLYSKTSPFIEVAARILFQDLFAAGAGALPVSVSGVGYDLNYTISPDPTQVISLLIDSPITVDTSKNGTAEPTPAPVFRVGDVIPLRTGVIYDHNHNPVPDGTRVRFLFSVISESSGSTLTQTDTETVDGIARVVYRIDRPGLLEIHAASEQDTLSNLLRLDITSGVSAGVTLVAPTPQPTNTLIPTPTITATTAPTPTATVIAPAEVKFQDWFLSLLVAVAGAVIVSWMGIRRAVARWGLRWALCGLIGGFVFYTYIALKFPGSEALIREAGTLGIVLMTVTGVVFGWGVGLVWRQMSARGGSISERTPGRKTATGPKSQSS